MDFPSDKSFVQMVDTKWFIFTCSFTVLNFFFFSFFVLLFWSNPQLLITLTSLFLPCLQIVIKSKGLSHTRFLYIFISNQRVSVITAPPPRSMLMWPRAIDLIKIWRWKMETLANVTESYWFDQDLKMENGDWELSIWSGSEVLRSLRPNAKDVTPSVFWRGVAWRDKPGVDDFLWKGRERAVANQMNIGTVSKASLGKLLRDRLSAYGLFRGHRHRLELNWTELIVSAMVSCCRRDHNIRNGLTSGCIGQVL